MIRRKRKLLSNLILLSGSFACSSCRNSPKPPTQTAFRGHTIGESSMGWSFSENTSDPLSRCQEMLQSPLSNNSLDVTQNCQNFVNNGDYLIIINDAHQPGKERAYRFTRWKVALIVVQVPREDESNLIKELNSRFTVVEPEKKWLGQDGAAVEIRPSAEYALFTGRTAKFEGFLVVVSSANI
jgi:hypothetical protein